MASFYATANVTFRLKLTDLTINAAWAAGNDSHRMRQALYAGDNRDLNLYFTEQADLGRVFGEDGHGHDGHEGAAKGRHANATTEVFCTFP